MFVWNLWRFLSAAVVHDVDVLVLLCLCRCLFPVAAALRGGGRSGGDHHRFEKRLVGERLPRGVVRVRVDSVHGPRGIRDGHHHPQEGAVQLAPSRVEGGVILRDTGLYRVASCRRVSEVCAREADRRRQPMCFVCVAG